MKKLIFILVILFCLPVYAEGFLDAALGIITTINPLVGGVIAGGAGIYEFVRRKKKTEKPGGICHDIARVLYMVADVVSKIAEISDKFIPQRSDSHKIRD